MSELVGSLVALVHSVEGKGDGEEEDVKMDMEEDVMPKSAVSVRGRGRDVKVAEPDPEILSLIENAFKSKLFRDLLLASRGELADKLMCTMQTVSPPPTLLPTTILNYMLSLTDSRHLHPRLHPTTLLQLPPRPPPPTLIQISTPALQLRRQT